MSSPPERGEPTTVAASLEQSAAPGLLARWPVATAMLVGVLGLLVQTVGYALGWQGRDMLAISLWYGGFTLVVSPFAALLLGATRTDHQRLGGSMAFTMLMYASWLLSNPVLATRFDENLHVSTLVTMVDGGGFFALNSMLPVSPHYPGLEFAAAGVHWVSGLPLFACQVFVVVLARMTFVLALFLLASRIGHSTRVGAATVLLYGASAQFYFFNAQFSYQTVAIAMMMAALYLLVRAFDSLEERPWRPLLAAQVCLGALAITHHLTSWLVVVVLWVLTVLFKLGGEQRRFRLTLITAELSTVVIAAWTSVIAPLLVNYLRPIFDGAGAEIASALDGGGGRTAGVAADGSSAPTWELTVMAASILLWIVLIVPAGWKAWRGGTVGTSPARYLPLLVALGYPFLQAARVSPAAGEIADRASTFVTLAMALIVGAWLVPRMHHVGRLLIPGALVLLLGGAILGGGPDWQRVPGPYLAAAEQRSIDSETIAVAEWAARYLPAGSHFAADNALNRFVPNFAPVIPVTQPAGLANVTPLFISPTIDQTDLALIKDNDIDFVMVDTRMIGQSVRSGSFFEGSNGYGPTAMKLDAQQLTKFAGYPGFDLVLDGRIKVYDVRSLRDAPRTFENRPPGGLPGTWTPWQAGLTGLLLLIALVLRGKYLDPRRFHARDLWRPAVVLPGAMVVGAVGVLAGFSPVAGAVVAVLVLGGVVGLTSRPRPSARTRMRPATWAWTGLITSLAVLAFVIAFRSAWTAQLDFTPLPPPLTGVGAP